MYMRNACTCARNEVTYVRISACVGVFKHISVVCRRQDEAMEDTYK